MNIITLTCGQMTAKVNASRGANCISLRHEGYGAKILRELDYENLDNPYLYGMPILFPVNRIAGGTFTFEGRAYTFPINEPNTGCHLHGTVHEMPFEVVRQTENESIFRLTTEARNGFPHKHTIELSYLLKENGLSITAAVTNHSQENMPCFLGYHTTFRVPFVEGTDPKNVFVLADVSHLVERNMENYLPTGNILPDDEHTIEMQHGSFPALKLPMSRHYRSFGENRIRLIDREKGLKVVYENDPELCWRLFYNGNADEYICLEPQTCMVNCQNLDYDPSFSGFAVVTPGECKEFHSEIRLEPL